MTISDSRFFCALMTLAMFFASPVSGQQEEKPPKFTEAIEVTSRRSPEPVVNAPVSISVVDQAQIAASPADNSADLLRGGTGLNVMQASARDVGVRARGATGVAEHRQLTLLDGRSIYLDFYSVVLWDLLPVGTDEIKQIEVLRGPGSAVWGPNALSGVINVRTKTPREMKGGSVRIGVGEIGTRTAAIHWAEASDMFSYKVSTSYFAQDAWKRDDLLPDGTPVPQAYRFKNEGTQQPRADLRFDWGAENAPFWSYKSGYGGTSGIFHSRLGPFRIEPGTGLAYAEVAHSSNAVDARVYWNRLRGDAPNLVNGVDFKFGMDAIAGDITARRPVGSKHFFVYGANVRHTGFDLSIAPGGQPSNEAGGFVEDTVIVSPRAMITAAAAVDYFQGIGTTISPRIGAMFNIDPNQSFRLAYSRAHRAPSFVDHYLSTTIPNTIPLSRSQDFVFMTAAEGNKDLSREMSSAIEAGYTARLGRRAVLTAAIYRNDVTQNIVFVPTEFYSPSDPPAGWPAPPAAVPRLTLPKTFSFINLGRVRDQGAELSWDMNWSATLSTRAAYTYQQTPRVFDDGPRTLTVNQPPHHQASLLANLRRPRWFGSAGATYTDKAFWADVLYEPFWGYSDRFLLVNGAFGVHAGPRTDIVLKATNLLDRPVKQHAFGDTIRRKTTIELQYRF
jgi:outer membrane receptor protein involved in Fe transport